MYIYGNVYFVYRDPLQWEVELGHVILKEWGKQTTSSYANKVMVGEDDTDKDKPARGKTMLIINVSTVT